MVVHSLGGVIERHQSYDMHQVYARSSCSIPVVFLLPQEPTSTTGLHSSSLEHHHHHHHHHVLVVL